MEKYMQIERVPDGKDRHEVCYLPSGGD